MRTKQPQPQPGTLHLEAATLSVDAIGLLYVLQEYEAAGVHTVVDVIEQLHRTKGQSYPRTRRQLAELTGSGAVYVTRRHGSKKDVFAVVRRLPVGGN